MSEDFLICSAIGTISSSIKTSPQKNNTVMISFKLSVSVYNEKITVKLFDLSTDKASEITSTFGFGDRIKINGQVKCDAFISKDHLVKGICIIPSEISLLEKSSVDYSKEVQIIK